MQVLGISYTVAAASDSTTFRLSHFMLRSKKGMTSANESFFSFLPARRDLFIYDICATELT